MRRLICLSLALVLMLLCLNAAASQILLPGDLILLDSEALKNTALSGVLNLADNRIEEIADGALDGLSLQGIVLPASIARVGQQHLSYGPVWAFVWTNEDYECVADDLNGLGSVRFLITDIGNAGKVTDSEYIYLYEAEFCDGFIYQVNDGAARLLCAIDNTDVPASVTIPDTVAGCPVQGISEAAFSGCPQVTEISLPEGVYVAEGAFDACPTATVTYRKNRTLVIWADSESHATYAALIDQFLAEHEEYAN